MRQVLATAICVIVSLVLLAIGTRHVHPHWLLATLHSLQLHAAFACLLAMAFALVVKRHAAVWLIFFAAVAVTAHTLFMSFEFSQPDDPGNDRSPSVRLLSINVLNSNFGNGQAIAGMIVSSGADVVNIMEAGPLNRYMEEIGRTYPYRIGCGVMTGECDQVMLSRLPIENPALISLSDVFEERFILGTVRIEGRPVTIGGIHTTKPYFDNFHSLELENAADAIAARGDGPLVLSGDFNASSLAPNMRQFLRATGLRTAGWEPSTWPTRARSFGIAIDHVYARAPLRIRSLARLQNTYGSNHYALVAEIALLEN